MGLRQTRGLLGSGAGWGVGLQELSRLAAQHWQCLHHCARDTERAWGLQELCGTFHTGTDEWDESDFPEPPKQQPMIPGLVGCVTMQLDS